MVYCDIFQFGGFRRLIFSIGHSTQPYAAFRDLIVQHGVTAIADVRSVPFSRHTPQFNQSPLKAQLNSDGIAYVYLGDVLGGRPNDQNLTTDGVADYAKMANSLSFEKGLDRVIIGSSSYTIALMCSERDPIDCHRCLLVGRALHVRGLSVFHILSNGDAQSQVEIEGKLIRLARQNPAQSDFFASDQDLLNRAYELHARRVAFSEPRESQARAGERLSMER